MRITNNDSDENLLDVGELSVEFDFKVDLFMFVHQA